MPSVGRNDPCPCGSGRKYKNCCLRRDQLSRSQELELEYDEAFLLTQLYRYAQSARFAGDLANALQVFWGGAFSIGGLGEVPADDVRRFLEWFTHDYRTEADGKPVLELFLEREASQYPTEAQERLRAWTRSVTGMYSILARADERVTLYDPLREREVVVRAPALARNARVGDTVVGRLYTYQGEERFAFSVMVLPSAVQEEMEAFVRNAYRLYQEEHPQADWDTFLRRRGDIFQAFMLSSRGGRYRSLLGPGTRFHDPAAARDVLFAHEERDARQRMAEQQGQAVEGRLPPVHRTASGLILPGHDRQEGTRGADGEAERSTILIPGRDA